MKIAVMPSGEDKYGINPELSVYPNPVTDYLLLKVKYYTPGNLSYQLLDMNGKLLENKKAWRALVYLAYKHETLCRFAPCPGFSCNPVGAFNA